MGQVYRPAGCVAAIVALIAAFAPQQASAIDGPGVTAIPNATWGGALDPLPHVVRLEFSSGYCTGTMIAPDLVATAGHCFSSLGANTAIGAGTVTINFGPGASTSTLMNSGGRTHGVVFQTANDFALVTIDTSGDAAPVAPVPILPRAPRVGEQSVAVGYGVTDSGIGVAAPDQNKNNVARKQVTVGGYGQHNEAAKNFGEIKIDGVSADFVQQHQSNPEIWTETGDSGGPGIQAHTKIPDRAYGADIGDLQKQEFVFSGVSGGPTPGTFDSSDPAQVNYPANPAATPDEWTRFDNEFSFIYDHRSESMKPGSITLFHNLPDDPTALLEEDIIKVFIRANYDTPGTDYLLNLSLWEEDDQNAGPFTFSGDMVLGPTAGKDDFTGIGFSAGRFEDGVNSVAAWDKTTAGDLVTLLDDDFFDLDWLFQINYGVPISMTDLAQAIEIVVTDLATIDMQIAAALDDIDGGAAIRGGLALFSVSEAPSVFVLIFGLAGIWFVGIRRGNATVHAC